MKLEDFVTEIYIPIQKITTYALNPNHPVGGDKAYLFEKYLGYTQNNYSFLKQQIEEKVLKARALEITPKGFGRLFQVDLDILGNYQGQKEKVRTGWIIKSNRNIAQLTTLYIIER